MQFEPLKNDRLLRAARGCYFRDLTVSMSDFALQVKPSIVRPYG